MMVIVFFALLLASGGFPPAHTSCPFRCSCLYHNLSDGSKARSVICNNPEISLVPANFPSDTSKLRIEKTAIKRIPSEAFKYLPNLEFLWMSFNALSSVNVDSFRGLNSLEELRLDGNFLTAFPWESLKYTPNIKLLDLHNNKLSSVPTEAAKYIRPLTYLDLSSNNLLTMPSEVLTTWMAVKPIQGAESSKIILGLHDNPWLCDCRLYDLAQFQKTPSLSVAFIDTSLRCAAPESLSGVLFSNADLRRCQEPKVHSAVSRIRSTAGNNVLLRCGAVGVPMPNLTWRRADGKTLNGTVKQENSKDGIVWSILNVPAVSFHDSGKYICKASNYAGSAEALIVLIISKSPKLDSAAGTEKKMKEDIQNPVEKDKIIIKYISPSPSSVPVTTRPRGYTGPYPGMQSDSAPEIGTNAQPTSPDRLLETNLSNLAANASSLQQDFDRIVRSVKVIGDTDYTVCLMWRAPKANNTTAFSVLYAVFGERDMRRINVSPGNNRIIIEGLVPKTKYIACVCVKGLIPKKEQCVIFSTDAAASANGTQKLINVVVISVACVIAVPLTVVVCCGALKRKIQKLLSKKSKDIQDSYVTFESLSPSTKAKGLEGDYLSKLNPEESNRLISARSSLDSESITKTEEQPNDYLC
ncbi:leucine-rich repeat, immunoglobulin-like domain and transmembrane domain-containing protein 1a [Ictalurus punctatus]|uniref:leucine-rich repeat, immunoglobulin-like domain and transmembrane domain-containing protein 1a n=1 Tax=Ictalurus punctatus TaxID=7998 RepID=UPI0008036791|nr:leucine-rich repeat, immunoglobulin-like domain and transmembrane domain-containing protein 1a [Ictalurus punctatus]